MTDDDHDHDDLATIPIDFITSDANPLAEHGQPTPIVDLWVNALSEKGADDFTAQSGNEHITDLLGGDLDAATTLDKLIVTMDSCQVDHGVVATGISAPETDLLLDDIAPHAARLSVALVVDRADRPVSQCARLRELAQHSAVSLVRVTPLVQQYPLNDKLYYPIYTTCAELGLPVSINIGVPGPQVRSACQHPTLLEDVLIDFKGLTVIGAHMGHPYESLLIQYMLKWPDLYLSNSAYLAKYMDPGLLSFMDSSRGLGRVLYASDHPFLPMERAMEAAHDLPLSAEATDAFMGDTAMRLLRLPSGRRSR
jgi:predicted TIM-barrel fold metal-dependent hydrolase